MTTSTVTPRWGLIGASDIAATRMVPAMRRLGHGVTAVCGSSAPRTTAWATAHGIPHATTSVEALLAREDIDAVYISTTNQLHLPHTLASVAAGKHVLCEKPLALSLADAWAMVDACRTAGVVLGVNHHLPGAATHRRIRELVAAGAVGRPLAARVFHAVALPERLRGWRLRDPGAGAGVVLDITCHDASVTNALFGAPVEATALAVCQGPWEASAEDAVMSVVRYGDGVLAQTHDAFTVAHARTGLEVHGTDGSITAVDVMTQDPIGTVQLQDAAGSWEIDVPGRPRPVRGGPGGLRPRGLWHGEPHGHRPAGVHALAVALAVQEAARTGRTTPVALTSAAAR